MKPLVRGLGALFVVGLMWGATASPAHGADGGGRVLVVSLPNVAWRDFDAAGAPALAALFGESVLADLSVSGVDATPRFADEYLTFGAGARAQSVDGDGHCG